MMKNVSNYTEAHNIQKSSEADKKMSKPGRVNRNDESGKYERSESFGMKYGGKDGASRGSTE